SIQQFDLAQKQAAFDKKPLLIDFYAPWCAPCKWMDETTFKDPMVMDVLAEKYVSIKVNIDDLDGFALKSKFDVKVLPTVIILDDKGRVIERLEETLGSKRMLEVLTLIDAAGQDIQQRQQVNIHPKDRKLSYDTPRVIGFGAQDIDEKLIENSDKQIIRLQMGVFKTYDAASQMVIDLNAKFIEPMVVFQESNGKASHYKVLMGEFSTREEALSYKKIIKETFKLDAIVF
ncbi:MAG TPA: thioredoxin family protein, partial [Saprospiraceae bacterium]|nr:thioredoxin family protein [Saprospiraceae bacterium]